MNTTTYHDGRQEITYHESLDAALAASKAAFAAGARSVETRTLTPTEARYRPCPCGSGKKHKFCCGK